MDVCGAEAVLDSETLDAAKQCASLSISEANVTFSIHINEPFAQSDIYIYRLESNHLWQNDSFI